MNYDYYKVYYELERNHWWFLAREKIISEHIEKLIVEQFLSNKKIKILNIGCATGRSSEFLSEYGTVTSIEFDKYCCEFTSEKTKLEIINGSITDLPFSDNYFDLVCAFDVLEHVQNDQLATLEMKRVTKTNGVILITVPTFMSLWSHHDVVNQHFKRYKLNEIVKLFNEKIDGNVIFASYFNFILFFPIYILRKTSNLLYSDKNRSGSGSDFETFKFEFLNKLLFKIMCFEGKIINSYFNFPFGVSLLFSWKKKL